MQKFVSGNDQEDCGDVVAETVFASEEIEEFTLENKSARFAVSDAEIMESRTISSCVWSTQRMQSEGR